MHHRLTSENNPLIYVRRRHSSKRKYKQHKSAFNSPIQKEVLSESMTTPQKDPALRNAEITLLKISSHEQLHKYQWSKEMQHSHPSRVNFLTLLASSIDGGQHHRNINDTEDKQPQSSSFISPVKQAQSVIEGQSVQSYRNQTATPERRNVIKQRSINRGNEKQFPEDIPYNFMVSHNFKATSTYNNNRLYQTPKSARLIVDRHPLMNEGRVNLYESLMDNNRKKNMQDYQDQEDQTQNDNLNSMPVICQNNYPRNEEQSLLFKGAKTVSFPQNRRCSFTVSKFTDRHCLSDKKEQYYSDNFENSCYSNILGTQEQNNINKQKQNWISSPSGSILVGVNMNISPFDINISDQQFQEDKMISCNQMKEPINKSDHHNNNLNTDQMIQYSLNRKKNEETILKSIENITHRKVQQEEQSELFQYKSNNQNNSDKKKITIRKEQPEKLAVMFNNGEWEMSEIKAERSINVVNEHDKDRRFTSLNINSENYKYRAVTADSRYNRLIKIKKSTTTTAQRNIFELIQSQHQPSKNSIARIQEQLLRFNTKSIFQ